MKTADNRVDTVLGLYGRSLADRYSAGEVQAIARAVFAERLGWDSAQLAIRRHEPLSESELLKVYAPLERLTAGEPLQYVLGSVLFHGLRLGVAPGVLIPRPETEELVERVLADGPSHGTVVDVGTGSGCIALALKRAWPHARVIAYEVSPEALAIARRNALRNALEVEWRAGDALAPDFLLPPCDLVVSNPPYVTRSEEEALDPVVREHEPHLALFVPGDDPLCFHRAIATVALQALPRGGRLWFEGHRDHAHAVGDLLRELGYGAVSVHHDLSGNPRFIRAER